MFLSYWSIAFITLLVLSGCGTTERNSPTVNTPHTSPLPTVEANGTSVDIRPTSPSVIDKPMILPPTVSIARATVIAVPTTEVSRITTPPASESFLKRRDVPPAGFKEQLERFEGGVGEPCLDTMSHSSPYISVDDAENKETGWAFFICFYSFSANQTIDFQYDLPDHKVKEGQFTTNESGNGYVLWDPMPGDALGKYTIHTTIGDNRVTTSFTINKASSPRLIVNAGRFPPGTTIPIYLAGFKPNEFVKLHIYYRSTIDMPHQYIAALPPIQVDEQGETKTPFLLQTRDDDPEGDYGLTVDPIESSGGFLGLFSLYQDVNR